MDLMVLRAVLGLDKSGYVSGLQEAEKDAEASGSTLGKALSTAAKVGVAAISAGSAAVTAFAKTSVDVGLQFDSSISQVAATMGMSVEDMKESVGSVDTAWGQFTGNLRDYAKFLGANTAFSATQAAQALNYMALAGYDVQTSMDMLPNVLNLAAAGGMDLARASDMVTDAQTAFGITLERTSQMVDEMAKAASTGNTNVEQLGDAFLVVGGLAQELNGGFVTLADGTQAPVDGIQELEIALTAMANAGIKGSEAGTHMRNMLLKLSSPTDDGVAQLEALGVSIFDVEGNMRSLSDIMGDLSGALGNLTQEQKIQAISDLFNTRDLASAEALLNAVGQDWDNIGASILEASGASEAMSKTQLDNLAGSMTLFKSALESAQIAISDELSPTLNQFVQFGTESLSTLTTAFTEGGVAGAMNSLSDIIAGGIEMLGEVIPQIVTAGGQLIIALAEGFVQAAPQLLDAAIMGIETLASGLEQNLPQMIEQGLQALLSFSEGLDSGAGKLIDAALSLIKTLVKGLADSLPVLIQYVPQIVINIANVINENAPKILLAGVQMLGTLALGIIRAIPDLIANFPKIIEMIVAVISAFNWLNLGSTIITGIHNGITFLFNEIPNTLKSIGDTAVEWIKLINWQTLGSDIIDLIELGIEWLANSIPSALSSIASDAASMFTDMDWFDIGKNIILGVANGVTSWAYELTNDVINSVSDTVNAVKSWLGIASPAKRLKNEVGKFMALGVGEGWKDFMPVDDMIDTMSDAVEDVAESVPMEIPMDDVSISTMTVPETNSGSSRGGVFAPVINVYGAQGQDVNELADEVMDRLTFLYDREEAAYAPA